MHNGIELLRTLPILIGIKMTQDGRDDIIRPEFDGSDEPDDRQTNATQQLVMSIIMAWRQLTDCRGRINPPVPL